MRFTTPRGRTRAAALVLSLLASLAAVFVGAQPAAATPIGGLRAAILMPYSGGGSTLGSGTLAGTHAAPFYGYTTWAEDLHAAQGTAVQARFQSSDGTVTLNVVSSGALLCSPGAGGYVQVKVSVGGTEVGRVVYEHLDNIPAFTTGQSISVGTTLGTLNQWSYGSCYQVNNSAGIHTHVEAQRSCYQSLSASKSYPATTAIGMLSSNYATNTSTTVCDGTELASVMSGGGSGWGGVGTSATFVGTDTVASGTELASNHYIESADGRSALLLQADGNLVLYQNGAAVWNSGTGGSSATRLAMQSDGNLVLYTASYGLVHNFGLSGGQAHLLLQTDGNLVVYNNSSGSPTWWTGTGGLGAITPFGSSTLSMGSTALTTNQYLRSTDGRYELLLLADGNLVLYGPGYHVLWTTGTNGTNADHLYMQYDHNLVLYHGSSVVNNWATGGTDADHLVVQNDGNLVLYGASSIWWTATGGQV